MGAIAAILAISGIVIGRKRDLVQQVTIDTSCHTGGLRSLWLLAVACFLEGLGYIVTATFLGVVALTLAEGNLRIHADGRRAAAFLTVSFGVGQMLGPVFAGMLADFQQGFAMPLLLATACVVLGGMFIALDRRYST